MNQDHFPYVAYMLRLWLENDEEHRRAIRTKGGWRASLEDPRTQEMQVFADLEALFDFLLKETERRASDENTPFHGAGDTSRPRE
ncbi:MAG: hypothetical protein GY759_05930 [Chloroflexi bacterium]|nr:hypothetical protein [Chloroflexota bacterium]